MPSPTQFLPAGPDDTVKTHVGRGANREANEDAQVTFPSGGIGSLRGGVKPRAPPGTRE